MKRKVTYILGAIAIVLIIAISGVTYAWLTSEDSWTATYTVGSVRYVIDQADIAAGGVVVPGQPIVATPLTATNSSNVLSNVRFTVAATIDGAPATIGTAGTENIVIAVASGWIKDSASNTWYYGAQDNSATNTVITDDIAAATTTVTLLNSITLGGAGLSNSSAGKVIIITVILQAKQAQYVTWTTLDTTSILYSTGATA